ncbi:unnamed protein product [Urochloa humidicola]
MAEPGRRRRRVAWIAPGDGADHITALPLDLRTRIASTLPFRQVARLATLSRPWRHIHRHAPVVDLELDDFLVVTEEILDEEISAATVHLNEDALARLELALARRGNDASGSSKVDTLRIAFNASDPRMRRHAGLIVALADARTTFVFVAGLRRSPLDAWSLDLSPAATYLRVSAEYHPTAPTIAGLGTAALQMLCLHNVVLREWPRLPSLRSLTLSATSIEALLPILVLLNAGLTRPLTSARWKTLTPAS